MGNAPARACAGAGGGSGRLRPGIDASGRQEARLSRRRWSVRGGAGDLTGRWAWPAAELAIVLVTAAVTALVVHSLTGRFDARETVAGGLGPPWAAGMVLIAIVAQLVQHRGLQARSSRIAVAVLAGAAVGIVMTPLMAGLNGTNQPPNTILRGDQSFHTEYVTRFAATWHLDDYTFRGLHAFYPPAWFWAAGRTANVLGITPWHIVKPFTILTIGAALLLAYVLWRVVLTPAGALSAAIGSSLVLTTQAHLPYATPAWYSPHSCFVAVTGIAWLAATLETVRHDRSTARLVLLAVVGAALALTYYLLFVLLVLVLVALIALPGEGRRDALRRSGALVGGMVLLTAVFWVPLLASVLSGAASQGHFVRPDFLEVSVGIGGPPALTALAIVAIAMLAFTIASRASQAVAGVIAGAILYQLVSVTSLVVTHNQLQPHRAVTMMWAAFGAAVPVALESFRGQGALARVLPQPVTRALGASLLAVAVGAIFLLGSAQGADLASGRLTREAHKRPNLAEPAAMTRFIEQASGRRPQQLTLLTGNHSLLVTEPYYGFLALRARYAHPKAHLKQRIGVLEAAAACPDAACATHRLSSSKFGPIDAMVLARTPTGYRVRGQEDGFPDPINVEINFKRDLLSPAAWVRRDFRAYTAFVRR